MKTVYGSPEIKLLHNPNVTNILSICGYLFVNFSKYLSELNVVDKVYYERSSRKLGVLPYNAVIYIYICI